MARLSRMAKVQKWMFLNIVRKASYVRALRFRLKRQRLNVQQQRQQPKKLDGNDY